MIKMFYDLKHDKYLSLKDCVKNSGALFLFKSYSQQVGNNKIKNITQLHI